MATTSAAAAGSSSVDVLGAGVRRQSWIGVDYFEALRHHQVADSTAEQHLRRISASISNILCIRWSPDGRHIAVSTSDGCIGLYHTKTGQCLQYMNATASASPATAIRFRRSDLSSEAVQHVLLATYTNGHITEFDYETGDKLRHLVEGDNQILALDYRHDGMMFVTTGKDRHLRLYDEITGSLIRTLHGHTNRVFAVRCHPEERNLIVSGGWDDTVRLWDVRAGPGADAVGLVFGPHICGDSVDVHGWELLTGSWADKDQIQIWDLRALQSDNPLVQLRHCPTMVYTAQFSTMGPVRIGLGGTKPNEIRIVDRSSAELSAKDGTASADTSTTSTSTGLFRRDTDGSYTSHFSPVSQEFASAGSGNIIRIVDAQYGQCREISAVGFRNVPKW